MAVFAALVPAIASAQKLGPVSCTIRQATISGTITAIYSGHPGGCSVRPLPSNLNASLFCGEASYPGDGVRQFTGCGIQAGGWYAECGDRHDGNPYDSSSHQGCVVTHGGTTALDAGCSTTDVAGGGGSRSSQTCGVAQLASCTSESSYYPTGYEGSRSSTTCGREPLVYRCAEAQFSYYPFGYNYCELVIGPAANPLFACRFDRTTPEASVGDLLACLP